MTELERFKNAIQNSTDFDMTNGGKCIIGIFFREGIRYDDSMKNLHDNMSDLCCPENWRTMYHATKEHAIEMVEFAATNVFKTNSEAKTEINKKWQEVLNRD